MKRVTVGYLWRVALLAAGYFAAGKFGLSLASVHESATAVWPPAGIALAAYLLLGYRVWPGVFLGAFLVNITTAGSVASSIGIATGNTLEGMAAAYLLNRFANGPRVFERPRDIFKFAVLAGLISTMLSATFGVTSLCVGGYANWADYGVIWLTWWFGDAVGMLIIAPLLILWITNPRIRWSGKGVVETSALLLLLFLVGEVVFGGWALSEIKNYPLEFLCLPFLVWVAFRFSQREAATVIVVLSGIAIRGTLHGLGPFVGVTQNESLLLLQAFMGVSAVTTLALAAIVSERRRAQEALQGAHDELERRVEERTARLTRSNRKLSIEIVERRRMERQLRQAYQELEESHEALKTAHLRLSQAAKLESIGRLAAGVAHEVKNPLAVILQGVDYLSKHMGQADENAALVLKHTGDAVKRADRIILGLLDFSTTKKLVMRAEHLNDILEQAVLLIQYEIDHSHVTVVKVLGERLPPARVDPNRIEQVFVNVLLNAIQAMPEGGTLTIRTSAKRLSRVDEDVGTRKRDRFRIGETVVVAEVEDTGTGIPDDVLPKIFDPFFTTKPAGKGTGLGLAVTQKIIELHGGTITVNNRVEGGVKVTMTLRVA